MSETGPSTTTTIKPNYPQGATAEKIKQTTGAGGGGSTPAGDEPPPVVGDIQSPGAPGGVTESGRPPKKVQVYNPETGKTEIQYQFYIPQDDANFILSTMAPKQRDYVLQTLYERGQYGGSQRGNGLNSQDISAFADLLWWANPKGLPWERALVEYKKQFPVKTSLVPGSGRRAPIQVSNTQDIKKVFKNAAQQLLGRAVDDKIADSFVNMIQAQEQAVAQQAATQSGGTIEGAPNVSVSAEQMIEQRFAAEQRVQNAARAASIIDNLVKGLAR